MLGLNPNFAFEDAYMLRKLIILPVFLALTVSLPAATDIPASQPKLSAADVVNKNVEARGGLQAWRGVRTLAMTGTMSAGGNQRATIDAGVPGHAAPRGVVPPRPEKEAVLPFTMELARSRKQRLELLFMGKKAIQVYDGTNGWKLRPFLNRLEVEPFTAEEIKAASVQADLDGPLVDYVAKGTAIELVGMEKIEARDTYKIKLTTKDGHSVHVWIDAKTFLEAKIEGQPRRLDGVYHPVEIYFRDYRPVSGLQIPFVLETRVIPVDKPVQMYSRTPGSAKTTTQKFRDTPVPPERIIIEQVQVNPKLDQSLFAKPEVRDATNDTVKGVAGQS
jgi:hypothetical protein